MTASIPGRENAMATSARTAALAYPWNSGAQRQLTRTTACGNARVAGSTARCSDLFGVLPLDMLNIRMFDDIPFAVTTVEPRLAIGVIRHIVREALSDYETDQRFRAFGLHAMSDAVQGTANEISRADCMTLRADRGRAMTGQNINTLLLRTMRMELGGKISGLNGNEVNTDVLEACRVSERLVEANSVVVEEVDLPLPCHFGDVCC